MLTWENNFFIDCPHFLQYLKHEYLFSMNSFKSIWVIASLFELNLAALESCSENKTNQQLCFLGNVNEGYAKPFPVVLDTILYVNILEIDEENNSIKIEVDFWTFWADPGLALSNDSSK